MIALKEIFPGVFQERKNIYTRSLVSSNLYGEKILRDKGAEYRHWNPFRSKIIAAVQNGLKEFPVKKESKILYLGVAEGQTAAHLSDIIGEHGLLVGLDVSNKTMTKFIEACGERNNLIPLLADARNTDSYEDDLKGIKFDFLMQDVSQKNQAEIFLKNSRFLKEKGFGLLSIKARSISSSLKVKKIFEGELEVLKDDFELLEAVDLKPFDKHHLFCVLRKK